MSGFLQVIPNEGFIIHAVPADRERVGVWNQIARGGTMCRRVRGRDSQGYPNLRLQFANWATDKVTAKPFSRNAEDFHIEPWSARRICEHCAKKVAAAEVSAE